MRKGRGRKEAALVLSLFFVVVWVVLLFLLVVVFVVLRVGSLRRGAIFLMWLLLLCRSLFLRFFSRPINNTFLRLPVVEIFCWFRWPRIFRETNSKNVHSGN